MTITKSSVTHAADKTRVAAVQSDDMWQGLTWASLADRVYKRVKICERGALEHHKKTKAWQRWATPLAWLTAVLAAISGVTVVAEQEMASTIFSLLTAALAGTNAALNPTETARKHKVAANSYGRLGRKLEDFAYFEAEADNELVPPAKREELRERLRELEDELAGIEEST